VWGGKKCKSHQNKRTDKKPKKIRKFSEKYQKEVDAYNDRVKIWKAENPFCAFPGCGMPTEDCHHAKSRGIHINDESTWVPLCRPHHDWVDLHSEEAIELKLSQYRNR
jgi:hypothetical protein